MEVLSKNQVEKLIKEEVRKEVNSLVSGIAYVNDKVRRLEDEIKVLKEVIKNEMSKV